MRKRWIATTGEHAASMGVTVLAISVSVGFSSASSSALGLFIAAALFGASLLPRVATYHWITLAVTAPWVVRLLPIPGQVGRALDFVDYPLVIAACLSTYVRGERSREVCNRHPTGWLIGWVVVLVIIIVASGIATGAELARYPAGVMLLVQPAMLLLAILRSRPSESQRNSLYRLTIWITSVQIILGVFQSMSAPHPDFVQGSLIGTGAGHHVMAGTIVAVATVHLARTGITGTSALLCCLAYGVAYLAGAKSILFLGGLPLGAAVWYRSRIHSYLTVRRAAGSRQFLLRLSAISAAVLFTFGAAKVVPEASTSRFVEKTLSGRGGKIAVARALASDLAVEPSKMLLGFGPGNTVSRFAHLTSPSGRRSGSPVELLGLAEASQEPRYREIASTGNPHETSSFLSHQSSLLGVVGDYGLSGLLAASLLTFAVARRILIRARTSSMGIGAVVIGWFTVPLGLVFDWWEQPPFMLIVALLIGLALSEDVAEQSGTAMPGVHVRRTEAAWKEARK